MMIYYVTLVFTGECISTGNTCDITITNVQIKGLGLYSKGNLN